MLYAAGYLFLNFTAFAAVAEILTYVYRMNGALSGGDGTEGSRP